MRYTTVKDIRPQNIRLLSGICLNNECACKKYICCRRASLAAVYLLQAYIVQALHVLDGFQIFKILGFVVVHSAEQLCLFLHSAETLAFDHLSMVQRCCLPQVYLAAARFEIG
jgi:hypothetical protein